MLFAAAWLFGGVTEDVLSGDPLTVVDVVIAQWLHAHVTPGLTGWMLAITNLHGTLSISAYVAAVAIYLAWRRDWYWLLCLGVVVPGGMAINVLGKLVFQRARPEFEAPLVTLSSFGYPSGHVAGATLFYGVVGAMLLAKLKSPRAKALVVLCALAIIALVAFTRIYLGAHYLSDVIAAFAAALAWLALCLLTIHRVAGGLRPR